MFTRTPRRAERQSAIAALLRAEGGAPSAHPADAAGSRAGTAHRQCHDVRLQAIEFVACAPGVAGARCENAGFPWRLRHPLFKYAEDTSFFCVQMTSKGKQVNFGDFGSAGLKGSKCFI